MFFFSDMIQEGKHSTFTNLGAKGNCMFVSACFLEVQMNTPD